MIRTVPGLRPRTGGVEEHAIEETLFRQMLQGNRLASFVRWLTGISVYSGIPDSQK